MKNDTPRKIINVDKPNLMPLWTLKQEDDVVLKLSLYKESIPFNITGQTIRLGAKTQKGLKEQIDGFTIQENNLDIDLKNTILVPGLIEIDLEFTDAGGKMTSASFFININSKVLNDSAIKATNEFDTFTKTVKEVEKDYQGLRKIIIDENNAANLQDQLNKTNSSLEQKADKNEIFSMANMGQDVKEAMTGGSVAVVGVNTILKENIVNKQVTPKKTDFFECDIYNILNVNENTYKGYSVKEPTLDFTDEGFRANTETLCGVFFELNLTVGKTYSFKIKGDCDNIRLFLTDKTTEIKFNFKNTDGIFIDNYVAEYEKVYIRFWFNGVKNYNIEYAYCYEGFNYNEKWTLIDEYLPVIPANKIEKINNSACEFMIKSKNLLDKSTAQKGYMANNGGVAENPQHTLFNFIDNIKENTDYYCNKTININFFSSNVYLSSKNGVIGKITTPPNTTKIRFSLKSVSDDDINTIQFEEGSVGSEYQEYGKSFIKSDYFKKEDFVTNNWKGKILCTYGDSITQGNTWQEDVVKSLQFGAYYNKGIGGTTVANNSNEVDDAENTSNYFCNINRINQIPLDTDVITIMGGTNDCGQSIALGDLTYPFDSTTFKGGLALTIIRIQERIPNADIFLLSPLSGRGINAGENMTELVKNAKGLTTEDYANAVKEVANFFSKPYINVFGETGINQFNRATYIADTVHPIKETGGKAIARVVINNLKRYEPIS